MRKDELEGAPELSQRESPASVKCAADARSCSLLLAIFKSVRKCGEMCAGLAFTLVLSHDFKSVRQCAVHARICSYLLAFFSLRRCPEGPVCWSMPECVGGATNILYSLCCKGLRLVCWYVGKTPPWATSREVRNIVRSSWRSWRLLAEAPPPRQFLYRQ
jgi:hypothetical protein